MIILGIETSCDETSAAVVDDKRILSNIIATQAIHKDFGGVVPEFASRAHIQLLNPIIRKALEEAHVDLGDIDGIAVTHGPGLAGSLLVGLGVAKGLALSTGRPLVGINHLEGHILANFANNPDIHYPFLCLIVSGGHTMLVLCEEELKYKVLGQTIDDAAGEAFDKVAKVLGLGFPGGPVVERTASNGNENAITFPIGLADKENLDFSFSGLKTAVLYHAQSLPSEELEKSKPDIAASFQKAVAEALLLKSKKAVEQTDCPLFILAGGVARNKTLRTRFENEFAAMGVEFSVPDPILCTDNAGMIARAGHIRLSNGYRSSLDLDAVANLSIGHS